MASSSVRERLAQDVGQWLTDGLVDAATADLLRERWDQPGLGMAQIVKWLGYAGGLFALFGLFGLVAAMSGSQGVAALELAAVGGGLLWWGVRLAQDPRGRQIQSSKVVLALGYAAFAAGAGVGADAAGLKEAAALVAAGFVALPVAFGLAYAFRNTFLLVLGLISLYHWVGAGSSMVGRSTYALEVQDPRVMALAALLGAAFGAAHGRLVPSALPSFRSAWAALGLTYLNLSLLILTVTGHQQVAWIAVWALAGVGQIVAGARLQQAVFTGFGVTALAINLFTRYFERFWDQLDAGLFFLAGGALLFGVGLAVERQARQRAGEGA